MLVLLGVAAVFVLVAARPPRPSLAYPPGQSLQHVKGNCRTGNELAGCDSGSGPRSFLQVGAPGDLRAASDALFARLRAAGWRVDDKGLVATDFSGEYSEGAQAEDIQPVLCRSGQGCLGLFRYEIGSYVLAWWQTPDHAGA